jgi:hypothetical protein
MKAKQWGWFIGLWAGGVLGLGLVAGLLRLLFRQML